MSTHSLALHFRQRASLTHVVLVIMMWWQLQWNISNPNTLGTEESVLISEVSRFEGLNCTQTWHFGQQKVRCPHFRVF